MDLKGPDVGMMGLSGAVDPAAERNCTQRFGTGKQSPATHPLRHGLGLSTCKFVRSFLYVNVESRVNKIMKFS